ncbi:1-acylglycerol-3-phosphate O-acyltransferase [Candidatus Pantoea carbekii]|nr:1-acylglycerol-3-phosphate O-acyltransferase [Candidatus Pantoea carbekii]
MLIIARLIIVTIYSLLICIFGSIWCVLFSPRNPRHVANFSHLFGRLSKVFGVKIELRQLIDTKKYGNVIYIANHQNNYDMITVSNILQSYTVTVGKKSLFWIPFFGQLYWLSGNLLIDRNDHIQSYKTLNELAIILNKNHISLWIFPEGTRSRGRGLLSFKIGAFYLAVAAKVPIIPIVVSNTHKKIKLNRWNNGLVIVEMLQPIDTLQFKSFSIRQLSTYCHQLMLEKLIELNAEVIERERNGNI